jgi:hypothetical protein
MPAAPILHHTAPTFPRRLVRVEYLGFQDVPDYREYRLAVCWPDGPAELRFRIEAAAFGDGRVRLQDGPDVCYQKLLRAVAAGETFSPDVVTIDDAELDGYRTAHTPVPKHRPWTTPLPSKPAVVTPAEPSLQRPQPAPVAALVTRDAEAGRDEGRRVSHAAFGVGVIMSSSRGHTTVCFDEGGPKTFVKSMVELEVLSEPHVWETGRRGKNRLRKTPTAGN